jgi:DNA-directed RNA polymerase alpha subunit
MAAKNKSGFDIKLAAPALRALSAAGIADITDLTKWTEKDLSSLHGIGPNAIAAIKKSMKEKKISFKSSKG